MTSEWREVRLGGLVDLLTGYPFQSKSYVEDAFAPRLLRGDNVGTGSLRWEGVKRWPEQMAMDLNQYWLREGDVVLAMDRPWIEAGLKYASVRRSDLPSLLVQRVARLRGTTDLETSFLRYLIGSTAFTRHILGVQTGTTVPHISPSQIKSFLFRLPPVQVQRAIAHILGTLDDKIDLLCRMNHTLEETAHALFKSWFVDFDPVRAKMTGRQPEGMIDAVAALFPKTMEASEHGAIPAGWRVGPAMELQASTKYACVAGPFGSNLTSKDYVEIGVPVIRGSSLGGATVWMQDEPFVFVSEKKADELSSNLAFGGDVVFTQRGTLGQVAVVPLDTPYPRFVLSQSQMKMTVDSTASAFYVAMYFKQPRVIEYIIGNGQHAGVPHINLSFLRAFKMLIPPSPVLRAFDDEVATLFASIRNHTKMSKTLAELRDTLLPKLLSGSLRIPDVERFLSSEVRS